VKAVVVRVMVMKRLVLMLLLQAALGLVMLAQRVMIGATVVMLEVGVMCLR
jgi:hypothetical protein